ncbi:glycerophosphodiester phosphodiesterase [Apibacter muscae]|uniref:glycerophosphodiester phosphodiesterase family protein n=1 Tax=Apibacter muscae TaxID=2509004 RepID=UPI0011AC2CFF|nr:glycerophosphodiester phosphodiesterase family protein [Apibacter muscae]TWP31090.1 glycerophosphodiester phosphodiesterase [Apibacter muscae]
MKLVQNYVPENAVIAHRGTTYWAPESTESAYRWVRNMGADYLEADLQITKDGVVLVMHDAHMKEKTDIQILSQDPLSIFYGKADAPTSEFTYEELMQLNAAYPFMEKNLGTGRDRPSFNTQHQYISTLEDLMNFAIGKRIKRDSNGKRVWSKSKEGIYKFEYEDDPYDNGNRPGIYLELNPGLEEAMGKLLAEHQWDISITPSTDTNQFKLEKVNVGNTNGKVVLQTFLLSSLKKLNNIYHGNLPMAYLVSKGLMAQTSGSSDEPLVYAQFINDGVSNGAQFFGPSISGAPNNYDELLNPWQAHMIRRSEMKIHPWTFDTEEQMMRYYEGIGFTNLNDYKSPPYCDAMFTNRADLTIQYYKKKGVRNDGPDYQDPNNILNNLGY